MIALINHFIFLFEGFSLLDFVSIINFWLCLLVKYFVFVVSSRIIFVCFGRFVAILDLSRVLILPNIVDLRCFSLIFRLF